MKCIICQSVLSRLQHPISLQRIQTGVSLSLGSKISASAAGFSSSCTDRRIAIGSGARCFLTKSESKLNIERLFAQNYIDGGVNTSTSLYRPVFINKRSSYSTAGTSADNGNSDPVQSPSANSRTGRNLLILGLLLSAFGLFWFWNKKKAIDEGDPLVMTLKRGVLASQKGNYEDAQKLFHQALEIIHERHSHKVIDDNQHLVQRTVVFGHMVNAAMKAGDYEAAEKLYKEMMKLCMASGKEKDDPAMVEISIKLASMYAMQSRDEEAETGFKFCLDSTRKSLEKSGGVLEADTNLLALYGLTCQSYARFLMKKKEYQKAIELYKSSLDVAHEVYGENHPQSLVVLNEVGSALVVSGKHADGIKFYKEAVDRASQMEDMDESLVAFHYNLGEAYIVTKDYDKAKRHCERSLFFAKKVNNPALIRTARQCISDVSESEPNKQKD